MRTLFLLLLLCVVVFAGGGPESTLVVVNARSELSRRIAAEYVRLRDIPLDNVVLLDKVPHLGIITLDQFRKLIWAPVKAKLSEVGPIRLVAYSADFPYSVRFPMPPGSSKAQRATIGGEASINGLTYLIEMVENGKEFYSLATNPYFGIDTGGPGRARDKTAEENTLYSNARSAYGEQRYEKSVRLYVQLVKTCTDDWKLWFFYARSLARAGKPAQAIEALGKSHEAGLSDTRRVQNDPDFASLRGRAEFRSLVERMQRLRLYPAQPFGHENAYLSVYLAYTGFRGNSLPEVLGYLKSGASVDGKRPGGTVYICRNKDVRSRARQPFFPSLLFELKQRGRKVEMLEGRLPPGKTDVFGAVVGTAKFDWNKSKSRIVPGGIVEHLTSYGAHFGTPGQTKCTAFLRAGATASSGSVREPLSIWQKFPTPLVHVHYADGLCLAEAYYRSVMSPYQLMIIGDGLAQPFAEFCKVEVDAPPMPWKGTVELKPRGKPEVWELWVNGRRMDSMSLDTTKLGDGEHDVRVVGITGDAGTRSYRRIVAKVSNGNAPRKPPAFAPPAERRPAPARKVKGPLMPGLVGEMAGKPILVSRMGDKLGGGSQASGSFRLKGVFRAPVDGFFQLALSGSGTVTVAGRCEKAPLAPMLFLPMQLAKGWHDIEIEYQPGRTPRFEMMLHGEVVWQPLELRHLLKAHRKQPQREGTFGAGLLLKWKRAASGVAGVAVSYKGKRVRGWTVESTVAKRFKALKDVAVLTAPDYARLTFMKPIRAKQIRIKAAGEAQIKEVVVIAK